MSQLVGLLLFCNMDRDVFAEELHKRAKIRPQDLRENKDPNRDFVSSLDKKAKQAFGL